MAASSCNVQVQKKKKKPLFYSPSSYNNIYTILFPTKIKMSHNPSYENAGFLQRVYYVVYGVWHVLVELCLPVIIAFAIIALVLFILLTVVMIIGNLLGYVDVDVDKKQKEEKSNSTKKTQTESSETTTTTIDISNKKTRIEMEIKLLEELIQAKQEQLKDLS
jgi:hypothetical protein